MSKKELLQLLTELLGPLSPLILRQIDKFISEGLTHKDIARAVYFLYDVEGRSREKIPTFGLGLVPYYVQQANLHYDAVARQRQQQVQQVKNGENIPSREVSKQKQKKKRRDIDISEL